LTNKQLLITLFAFCALTNSFRGFGQGFETCPLASGSPINITTAAAYVSNGNTCAAGSTDDYNLAGVVCINPSTTQGKEKIYYICAATTGKIKVDIGSFALGCYDFTNKPWLAPSISIWSGCPSTGSCIGGNAGAVGAVTTGLSATAQVTAGSCYYVMIDNYIGDCPCFSYNIAIQYVKDCDYATTNPITIPYSSSGSTCSSDILNSYNSVGAACVNQTTTTGRDRVYYFCATTTGNLKVDLAITALACTDLVNKPWPGASVTIWQGCPGTGTCIGGASSGTSIAVSGTAPIVNGQCYYVMIDNLPTYCSCFNYNVAMNVVKDCDYALLNPIAIPYNAVSSTCGTDIANSNNPTGATCIDGTTTNGPDRTYYFCATTTGKINITLTNFLYYCNDPVNSPYGMPSLSVWQGCPNTGTCLAGAPGNAIKLDEATSLDVIAGQCYYILIDNFPDYCPCYDYRMIIDYVAPAVIQPSCTNIGFGSGFSGWSGTYGRTMSAGATTASIPIYTPAYYGISPYQHAITSGAGVDPYGGFPVVYPGGPANSARLGNLDTAGYGGATLEQTFNVTTSNALFTYYYAAVVQDAGHNNWEQPFFKAEAFDCNGNPIACGQYLVVGGPGIPGFTLSTYNTVNKPNVYYKDWTPVAFNLTPYIGSCVKIKFTVGDCSQGAHFAYAYIDAICEPYKQVLYTAQNCPGDPAQIKAPDGFTNYVWTGPGIVGPGNVQSININQSGSYHVNMAFIGNVLCATDIDTTLTINILPPFAKTPSFAPAACGVNNGTASVSVTAGGTPAYTYTWSNGGSAATISGLAAGKYIVTIKDSHGCTFKDSASVTVNAGPSATMGTPSNITCSGTNNGSATVTAAGGSPNYTYSWSNGSSSVTSATTHLATGLSAATYTVTIKDGGACTATTTVVVTAPAPITPTPASTQSTCGNSNGTAGVTASGGSGALTYSWNTGSTAQTITALPATTYTATVKDANGCTVTTTATVSNVAGATSAMGAPSNITCNGGNNGSASVTAAGGTVNYTYTWSNGSSTVTSSTTNNITGLTAAGYTVTVTDANGCQSTTTTLLTQPSVIAATPSATQSTCGATNGTAGVTASGGSGALTYNWSSGGTAQTITGLAANGYTVTVKDANGCTVTTVAIVSNIGGATSTMGAPTNINCSGGNNGAVGVTASGGTGPYTYSWSSGASSITSATTNNISGLTALGYTVTITDASGCQSITNVTLTEPLPISPTATGTSSTCGNSNGTAGATATGGSGTLSYSWNTGSSAQTISGLSANSYTVTVKDANSCTITKTVTLVNVAGATSTMGAPTNITCNAGNDGAVGVTASGGAAPYTYSWSSGASTTTSSTTNNLTGLTATSYTVTLTDANGCQSTTNVILTQPPALLPTASGTASTCGNSNGTAGVTATGGSGTLSYSWNTGSSAQTISGIAANTYTVTVKDANGCTTVSSATVSNTGGATSTMGAPTNITCGGGSTGTVGVTASGGTAPYTYSWSNGISSITSAVTSVVSGLTAAGYTVTVTDASGCQNITNTVLTEPPPIVPTPSATQSTCGGANGTAGVTATGGSGSLSYSWSTGSSAQTLSGLAANGYTVTVKDANACTITTVATVTSIGAATSTMGAPTSSTCTGGNNGSVGVTVTGGVVNYTYSWSNGSSTITSSTTDNITGLTAGGYTVTITDANACQTITNVSLTDPLPIAPTIASTPSACGNANGTASVTATGGTATLTYSWNNGINGQTITGLAATDYTVTVTDGNNCTITQSVTVTNIPGGTSAMTAPTNINCSGGTNGIAGVTASAGTGPYTYSWSNGIITVTNATANTINGLTATGYTVTVVDGNGCQSTTSTILTEPSPIIPTPASTSSSCGSSNGTASVTASGGTGAFSYSWSTGSSAQTINGLAANSYTATVTDANACTITTTAAVNNTGGATSTMGIPVDVSCNGGNNGSVSVTAVGGITPYTYSWSNGSNAVTSATADNTSGLSATGYTVTITDGSGCISTASVVLTAPPAITSTTGSSPASCGQSNGSVNVSATGGTGALNYSWSSGSTGQTVNGLPVNSYTVTITDANNCTATTVANISSSSGPAVAPLAAVNLKCAGDNNGSATVSASGGTGVITYTWSTGVTSQTVTALVANTYTVTVSDASGCSIISTVSITQPTPLAILTTGTNTKCKGSCDGQALVIPVTNSGTAPYQVTWNTTATSAILNGLCAGTYSVTIVDANGCIKDSTALIDEPAVLDVIVANTPVDCNQNNGTVNATVSGGTPGYVYNWSNGASAATVNNLSAATYTVTITDNNNCTTTQATTIQNNNGVTAAIQNTIPASCFGGCNASATALPTGGTAPYNYAWSSTASAQTAGSLCQGTYTVTITDNKNCTSTAIATITQPPAVNITAASPGMVCIGQSTLLTASVSGGTPVYSITWNPGAQTGATLSVQLTQATTFTVSATDANGCTAVTQTLTVNTNPPLNIQTNVLTPACSGTTVTIKSQAAGGDGTYTYTWLTTPQQNTQDVTVTATTPQTYTVIVSDGCGTPNDTAMVTLDVNPIPIPAFISDVTAGCPVLCVNFQDKSTIAGGTITKWTWNFGDSTSIVPRSQACFDTPGKYSISLSVTSDKGCVATKSIVNMITVYNRPTAAFDVTPTTSTIQNPVFDFTDQSVGAYSWLWDFGDPVDGKTSTSKNPTHIYSDTGNYCVLLTVKSAQACKDTATHCVDVKSEFAFFVPNAFTPNGDKINDTFNGKGIGIKKYKMIVFDRWGNLIFTTENLNMGWNGTTNGGSELVQQDVYVYKIILSDIFDKEHNYIGHVSMVK
jgi:gliding motility-associated-like protein